jgi:glycosyltransferase involved in cell wall biosynthesis
MPPTAPAPRIAYLTGEYPKASHTFILREIAALRALGAQVMPASIRRPEPDNLIGPEEEAAERETFYVLHAARNPLTLLAAHLSIIARTPLRYLSVLRLALRTGRPGAKGTIWQLFYFLEAGVLAAHIRHQGAARLHNHFADSSANVALLAAEFAGIPFSFTLHGPNELFAPESWHLGEKIARSDVTVCISHFARSQAMLFSDPEHWHKLRIVHCGVEPERYDGPLPEPRGAVRILFVGRLTGVKGLRVLFKAFEACRRLRSDMTLVVVGDGPDRSWAEAEARRIGSIEFLGFRSQAEVAAELGQSDLLVLPSFAEGVPVVLMEAMASARPVIATRVGGVSELVEDGVSGLLVAPGNEEALAAALLRLADDPEMRRRMGEAGRARVRADFDVEVEARRLLALFTNRADAATRPDPLKTS